MNSVEYKKIVYPDGTYYLKLLEEGKSAPWYVQNQLYFKFKSYADLWELAHLHDVLQYANRGQGDKKQYTLIIPNLLDAQADKRFAANESSGLKLVLEFLKGLEIFNYRIFHPHNQEVVEAVLGERVECIMPTYFITEVLNQLPDDVIVLAPDAGAYKWISKVLHTVDFKGEIHSASKSRDLGLEKISQVLPIPDFEKHPVLIIDDICVHGGTFLGLAALLKEKNVGDLYLATSHMTVETPKPDLFYTFTKVFTTNSKFDTYPTIPHEDGGGGTHPSNLFVIKQF